VAMRAGMATGVVASELPLHLLNPTLAFQAGAQLLHSIQYIQPHLV
jgi:hypothetical protein